MFKTFKNVTKPLAFNGNSVLSSSKQQRRTFLSEAYYCKQVWSHRLTSPIFQKININDFYCELDQRFQKTRQISAVDVDIFANAITNDQYNDELLDVVHKLRLSAETGNTLNSTSHAVVRVLMDSGQTGDLLNALDDRLNYGLFLDYYTSNILMDFFWKQKEYASGARVASQLMLQEEFEHPLSGSFSLLHCYKYLLKPDGWPEYKPPEEPEDEVKIRVKYLRNPYDDDHFDLRDPKKIVGKTLALLSEGKNDSLHKSLYILGCGLYNKQNKVIKAVNECKNKEIALHKELIDLLPEECKKEVSELQLESVDIENLLKNNVEAAVRKTSETDITNQCKIFEEWELERKTALEEQNKRLSIDKRISNIEELKSMLKEKETKLWFFDNEEQIELDIESKRKYYPKLWFGKKKKPKKIDENYIPPEVQTTHHK